MEGTKIVAGELAAAFGPVLTDSGFTLIGLFVQPARIVLAQNLTDQTLIYSFDGSMNNFLLPPNGFLLLDVGTNKGTYNTAAMVQGNGLYVKAFPGSNPSLGYAYMSYWYAA